MDRTGRFSNGQLQNTAGNDGVEKPKASDVGFVKGRTNRRIKVLAAQLMQMAIICAAGDLEAAIGFIQRQSVISQGIQGTKLTNSFIGTQIIIGIR